MTTYIVIAAMLALVCFNNDFWRSRERICVLCGGRARHRKDCPQKDRDE